VAVGQVAEGDTTAGGPADDWAFIDWQLVRLNDTGHLEAGSGPGGPA
jgi:hypothetical protein